MSSGGVLDVERVARPPALLGLYPRRPGHRLPHEAQVQAHDLSTATRVTRVTTEPSRVQVDVVRVFTDENDQFGNLLGIVDGAAAPPQTRQRIAATVGYSETVFVDDYDEARLHIFTPSLELPFAGHPTVGTAWWLIRGGYKVRQLVVPAGTLDVTRDGQDIRVRAKPEWAPEFGWHQVGSVDEVEAADPSEYGAGQHYVWAWMDESAGAVRSRMFAPAMGIREDEATGAAAIGLTARRQRNLAITQGKGSRIITTWEGQGWATVGGRVVEEPSRSISF
jgi:predicted PhzF superfamily epimerase YddE/YHI9